MHVFKEPYLPGSNSSIFCRFRHYSWVTGAPAFSKGLRGQKSGRLWTLCRSARGKRENYWGHLCHESHEEEGLIGPGTGRSILASHPFCFLHQHVHCRDSHLPNWHLGWNTFSSVTLSLIKVAWAERSLVFLALLLVLLLTPLKAHKLPLIFYSCPLFRTNLAF